MDERKTLQVLGWTVGIAFAVTFILNAIALPAI